MTSTTQKDFSLNIWKALVAFVVIVILHNLLKLTDNLSSEMFNMKYEPWSWTIRAIKFLAEVLFFLIIYFGLRKYIFRKLDFPESNKTLFLIMAISLGMLMAFIQPLLIKGFSYLQGFEGFNKPHAEPIDFHPRHMFYNVSTVLLAPFMEELFFRGFILQGLLNKYKAAIGILVSAILFGFWHYPFLDPDIISFYHVFLTFMVGVLTGVLYLKTRKLFYPILLHISMNLLVVLNDYLGFIPF